MVPATTCKGQTLAVFGLGRSGMAAARALVAGGARALCWDDNEARREAAGEAGLEIVDLRGDVWRGIDALVLSPGVPLTHPAPHWTVAAAGAAGVPVFGDTELFERERAVRAPASRLVAVTGTNGKSTTAALIDHVLRAAGVDSVLGGNIGVPVLALDDVDDATTYVIEYSSYQIDLTPGLAPDVGILLNLSEDHLDRHGTFANYAAVKARLVAAAARKGLAVIGVDDTPSEAVADRIEDAGGRVLRISARGRIARGLFAEGGRLRQGFDDSVHEVADLNCMGGLRGAHNWQNAAAAYAAARALGVAPDRILAGLASFPGLAHRMEQVGRIGRVLFVNDSKATNADAAARSLAAFGPIYWIAGGRAKSGGIASLAPFFDRVAHAYLIGEAAEDFVKTLDGKVPFTLSGDLGTAVAQAAMAARGSRAAEPVVLLAPACASFDQFADFEARGEAFRAAVKRLAATA